MSQELIKSKEGAVLDPSKEARLGFEEPIDKDDLIVPRAKLLQSKSPEVEDPHFEGQFRAGEIINSLTKEYLKPGIFIPIFKFSNWIKFNPRDSKHPDFNKDFEPSAIIWRTNDPHDPRVEEARFGEDGAKPTAVKFLNFLSYFPGVPMPIVVSFAKSSYSAGKQLLSLSKYSPGHMFTRKYKLVSNLEKKNDNSFFVLAVIPSGITEGEDLALAHSWHTEYTKMWNIIEAKVNFEDEPTDEDKAPY